MQRSIPYMQLRGGSSKGLYFCASDLPSDPVLRNKVLIAAIGADKSQIDGLGGADPLTSKVAIVGLSDSPDADIDYLLLRLWSVAIESIPRLTAVIFWLGLPPLRLRLAWLSLLVIARLCASICLIAAASVSWWCKRPMARLSIRVMLVLMCARQRRTHCL